jgi:arylsulfatase
MMLDMKPYAKTDFHVSKNWVYTLLKNEKYSDPRNLYWEHMGNKAVRTSNKKLVKLHNRPWELYNLETDPTELENLANHKPGLKDSLENLWNEWAIRSGVMEWPLK